MKGVTLENPEAKVGIHDLLPTLLLADNQAANAEFALTWETEQMEEQACWARASVQNTGSAPLSLKGFRWRYDPAGSAGPALHFPVTLQPCVYATENLRGEYFGTGTVEGDRFFYPLGNQHVEYGHSEDHLFPGVFLFAAQEPLGLLIAQASQERFYAIFRFCGKMERKDRWLLEIEERVSGITSLTLAPGEKLQGEKIFFQLATTNDPQQATTAYFGLLRADGAFSRRKLNPLPAQRIYCSWNYDFFANIDQSKLLAQLPILKDHFPSVKFIQLDDGYQSTHAPGQRAMIDLCYGDLEHPFDPSRFPDGPKALADSIKASGLRPAIWRGLWASTGSKMLKDHPDWILRDDTGQILLFNKWYGGTAILDPSLPGVQEYLDRMCRTVFQDWGFEGVKLDFSSFAFNGRRVRYGHPGRSAVELRHQLEGIFRRYLPEDGFFGWCVVAGTAQPFLSQADYFRNAIDINRGDWPAIKRVAMWTANTDMLLQERSCLPNVDSIGWSEEFDETSWLTWLNFSAVAGGALELSGDLRKLDASRLKRLARTLELSDPSQRVRCLNLTCAPLSHPPALWLSGEDEGPRTLGVFNWTEEASAIPLACPALAGVSGKVRDPWTDKVLYASGLPAEVPLRARESLLLRF
ncbi:MAG: alpha-galactosidase [Planctomycetes bacterium]|nr:alpha-galactosidase [Planctomycetota bacterium]